jgi:hypothetical protein
MVSFEELLEAARGDPSKADYKGLRMAYAGSADYNPYAREGDPDAILRAFQAGDWRAARTAAERILQRNYLHVDAHMACAYASRQLGEEGAEAYHLAFARGILDSVFESGDGLGFETAFVVIDVAEEYAVLRALGIEPSRQSLVTQDGHEFDVFDVNHPKTGKDARLYFNIDLPKGWLKRSWNS